MKSICIFGAGGFASEVFCILDNRGYRVEEPFLEQHNEHLFDLHKHLAVIAVGSPQLREKIASKIIGDYLEVSGTTCKFLSRSISIGEGQVICDGCILTCNIQIGRLCQLNLATTIGHDCVIGDYFTTAPGVHISGNCTIGNRVYFGTNSCVIEGITICDDVVIGAGAVVVKDIIEPGTYVGVPARKI